jgi:GT2 family glycosyltransferase
VLRPPQLLRASRAWPLLRRAGRPVRAAGRAGNARLLAARRHLLRGLRSLVHRAHDRTADLIHAHPRVAALTWLPARRAARRSRVAWSWVLGWPVRRDPDRFARRYLDRAWYVRQNPDAGAPGIDAWQHYRTAGVARGAAPNPVFDVAGYCYDHPDVAAFGGDPLLHWVRVGRAAGATPHPLFDANWYRARNPDLGRMDPYLHYLLRGRAEGRAASAAVDPGVDIAGAAIELPGPDREVVTVIVPAFRRYALTFRCLYALASRTARTPGVGVVLADDDPDHPLAPHFAGVRGLRIRTNAHNLGFLRNCNRAAGEAPGDYLVLLNNDTVVQEGWLDALLATVLADPRTALVGCRLLGPDGRLQEAGVIMEQDAYGTPYGRGDDPERPEYRFVREVDCVGGACMLVRRGAFEAVGGFDEAFAPAFFEEYDLAFALRAAGWRVRYQPASRVVHAGSATYSVAERDRQTVRNRDRFRAKWAAELVHQHPRPAPEFVARERPRPGGTILVVDDRVPEHDRHAGGLWMAQWLELLRDAGLKVILAPDDGQDRQPYAETLRQEGIEVLAPAVDLDAWLDDNGRFLDWVLLARPLVAARRLPAVRRWTAARVLYFTHDLHWLREDRRHALTGDSRAAADSRYLREIETRLFREVDAVLTPSNAEVPLIRAMAPGANVRLLTPFADDVAASQAAGAPPLRDRDTVMFLGGFAHLPNIDAALVLVREVMPLVWREVPSARVLIVGDAPPPEVRALESERVEVTGHLVTLGEAFGRARMTVSPLRFGSGVKGKIITSLGAGVPVVTTAIGNEGLDLRDGIEAMLGDTPEELAAQVVRLFREPSLPDSLAAAGHRVLDERFSADRTRRTLLDALGPRPTRAGARAEARS